MSKHRNIFLTHNNHDGPWLCMFCGEPILKHAVDKAARLTVHHVNGKRSDNRVVNLKASHNGCHTTHHWKLENGNVWRILT